MKTNVKPLLLFFIEIGQTMEIREWLMPDEQELKERRWLRIVGWLMGEVIFVISKKTVMARFLMESREILGYRQLSSIRTTLDGSIPPDLQIIVEKILAKYF